VAVQDAGGTSGESQDQRSDGDVVERRKPAKDLEAESELSIREQLADGFVERAPPPRSAG
jgi:hypothetical protein